MAGGHEAVDGWMAGGCGWLRPLLLIFGPCLAYGLWPVDGWMTPPLKREGAGGCGRLTMEMVFCRAIRIRQQFR